MLTKETLDSLLHREVTLRYPKMDVYAGILEDYYIGTNVVLVTEAHYQTHPKYIFNVIVMVRPDARMTLKNKEVIIGMEDIVRTYKEDKV